MRRDRAKPDHKRGGTQGDKCQGFPGGVLTLLGGLPGCQGAVLVAGLTCRVSIQPPRASGGQGPGPLPAHQLPWVGSGFRVREEDPSIAPIPLKAS